MRSWFATLLCLLSLRTWPTQAQSAPKSAIDDALAFQYFQEAEKASERDEGKLWKKPIIGPMLFVEPETRRIVADRLDHEGLLVKEGDVFVGRLPDKIPIANHPTSFGGVRWAMIVWPFLTSDRFQRVKLMAHESFHRLSDGLHIPVPRASPAHLDTRDGRIWLQLEWRALHRALLSSGEPRHAAIQDALTFRAYRRSLFPEAAVSEHAFEMNEGLAEYTGYEVAAKDDGELIANVLKTLEDAGKKPTLMDSFAYTAGPAYGVLLDHTGMDWRKTLTPQQDLGELLQKEEKITLPSDLQAEAEKQALQYDGDALRAAETAREDRRRQQIAAYRKRFLDSSTLLLPLSNKRTITLVSNGMVPLGNSGTVYPIVTIRDAWGTLEVSKGALLTADEKGRAQQVILTLPEDPTARPLTGVGWTLHLSPDWTLIPGSRVGDYQLKKLTP